MDREVSVFIELPEGPQLVGKLWAHARKGRQSGTFRYEDSWLQRPDRFALEPALTLDASAHHTNKAMFGALGDSAPDRWGRVLMVRAERMNAESEGRKSRTLLEVDYLLGVTDIARQGALRFAESEGSPFLAIGDKRTIPPLIELPRLLAASELVDGGDLTGEQLRLLLAPGSSLGGARPKASVWDRGGHLAIAKFPNRNDQLDIVRWEAVALSLAERAGIQVPPWRVENVNERPVLVLRRFDRSQELRIPFLSAMSMLGASDMETHSYLDLVEVLRQHGARPRSDLRELWRRMVFSVLISNTDDHLRNHGFMLEGSAWVLSPAYDMNPVPAEIKPRFMSTAIDYDNTEASYELALDVAEYFELDEAEAKAIGREVAEVVSTWRRAAREQGLLEKDIRQLESAFEHEDLERALG